MIKFYKYFLISLLLIQSIAFAEIPPANRAAGLFLGIGVGPRIPVGDFANTNNVGYGLNLELSYTDNEFLPVFLYLNAGFEQYSGSQSYYKETEFSNYNINSVPVSIGARYFFPPLMESIFLLMPIVQASANYNYSHTLIEYDEGIRTPARYKNENEFGFSAGVGVSAFMMELITSYNYLPQKQFISVDLKVRIPLYINF